MIWTRLTVSLAEFGLSIFLSIFVIFWSYKSFVELDVEYDVEEELKKGNNAVAILLTSLMAASSIIMQKSMYPVMGTIRVYLSGEAISVWLLLAYCLGQLVFGFLVTVATVKLSLRVFERLSARADYDEEKEVQKGNTAVAIVMAGVVLITAFYLQDGVSGVTKALIPRPALGQIRVLR